MKNKKVFWLILMCIFTIGIILLYLLKPMRINDIYDKPNFTGIITEIYDKAILVSIDESEDEINSSDKMNVSLNAELKDIATSFNVGDRVKIFYDGTILESYPAQINNVYSILLINE